jgi:hypothetical protein
VNTEKQKLIQEMLDEQSPSRREATLLVGRQILRQRRVRRVALRGTLVMASILFIAMLLLRNTSQPRTPVSVIQSPVAEPALKGLSDAELLALFPDTAVGIITLEDGTKRLIFPRPGDEARYVKRM